MKTQTLDPLVSEFTTESAAADYDRGFRRKVQASLDDPRASIPHDEAMARLGATITGARRKKTPR